MPKAEGTRLQHQMNKLISTDAHEMRDGERRFKIRPCLTAKDSPQTVARSPLLSQIPWLCISNAMGMK